MKALGCQPVESTSLSEFWFSDVNLHPYAAARDKDKERAREAAKKKSAGEVDYVIVVKTADAKGASTNSNVSLSMVGEAPDGSTR